MNPIVGREQFEALQAEYPQMPFYEIDTDRVKIPAGWMIDQCGWKGKALGPAAVHDKQALVLVNRGGAKGADVIALSDAVRASVRAKFGEDHPTLPHDHNVHAKSTQHRSFQTERATSVP